MALLRQREFSNAVFDNAEEEEAFMGMWGTRRRRRPKDPNRFPKVPSDEGAKLMRSGAFGADDDALPPSQRISRCMLDRELGLGAGDQRMRSSDAMKQACRPPPPPPGSTLPLTLALAPRP